MQCIDSQMRAKTDLDNETVNITPKFQAKSQRNTMPPQTPHQIMHQSISHNSVSNLKAQWSSQKSRSSSSIQVIAFPFPSRRGVDPDPEGPSFKYLRRAKAAALYVAWYIDLNSSSSAETPGAGVSARRPSGTGVAFVGSGSGSAGVALLADDRAFERWKP